MGCCSNASDALDKLRFLSVTDPSLMDLNPNLEIRIKTDPDAGTITIMWAPEIKLSVWTLSLLASLHLGSVGGLRAVNLAFLMMWTVAAEGIPSCFWGFSFFLVHMKFYVMILTGVGGFVDQRYWYWHDTWGTYWESRHHCTKWDCKVHASSKGEFGGDISKHQYWILLILGWYSLGEWDHEISFRRGNYVLHVQLVL